MLPKKYRLTTRQFDSVWKRGTTVCGAFVCVRSCVMEELRISAIAPKKLARTAVKRNHIRRRLYAALEHSFMSIQGLSVHLIITPKKDISSLDFDDLISDIASTIKLSHQRTTKLQK